MSLFREARDRNRENFPACLGVFVDVLLDVLRTRDHKGLYSRAEHGLIQYVAGVDMDYDCHGPSRFGGLQCSRYRPRR